MKLASRANWATVGWQGIVLKAPADWGLAAVTGDRDKGYFRVDSPSASAVEVRWSAAKSPPDLAARAGEFLDSMRREGRKRKARFSGKIEAKRGLPPGTPVRFTWKGDRNGYGLLRYCAECGRVMIAQVVASHDGRCASLAAEILDSITDHREDGWQDWAVFGLRVAVPPEFRLEKQILMSGYIQLAFKARSGELAVEQWGLASSLLRRSSLEEWYPKDALAQVKHFKVALEPVADEEHPTLRLLGKRIGIGERVKTALRSLTLRPLPQRMHGYAWHCPDSNRLFSIRLVHDGEGLAERIREEMSCH